MKKNIISALIGLLVGFAFFWGSSIFSRRFGIDKLPLYQTLGNLSSGNPVVIMILYLVIGILLFAIYWLLLKFLQNKKEPFPIGNSLLFAVGFIIPLALLGWAIAIAFSHWTLF